MTNTISQQEDEVEKLQKTIEQVDAELSEKRKALEQYLVDLDLG